MLFSALSKQWRFDLHLQYLIMAGRNSTGDKRKVVTLLLTCVPGNNSDGIRSTGR
jgi:hypothetical protein